MAQQTDTGRALQGKAGATSETLHDFKYAFDAHLH
jgi:hypothetical protein